MSDKYISKSNSLIIKGIAIIMMIVHHLFGFSDRINEEYISIYKLEGMPIEYFTGIIGKCCVSIFLFIGGYGLYRTHQNNVEYYSIFKRIYKMYLNYWIVFIVFVPIGLIINKINLEFKDLFLNFIGISSSINKEWWFFICYVVLVFLYPVIIKIVESYNKYYVLIGSFFIFCISSVIIVILYRVKLTQFEIIFNIMNMQFIFISGIIICKYKIFDKINECITNNWIYIPIFILSVVLLFIFPIKTLIYSIVTPILVFVLVKLIKRSTILKILGKHSGNIWMSHTFFCYYYFQSIIFIPRYSILIAIWTILLSLISSILLNKIKNILLRCLNRVRNYYKTIYYFENQSKKTCIILHI